MISSFSSSPFCYQAFFQNPFLVTNLTMSVANFLYEKIQKKLFKDFDVYQLIRLVIIVGGYIFLRTRVSDFLKQRQLKTQLEHDNKKKENELINDPTGQVAEAEAEELFLNNGNIAKSEKSWGWGKTTRRKVKKQQALFEKEIEKAATQAQAKLDAGYNSDDEINEFLQD